MSKTIELLESIGRDASLRHASREELVRALDALNAGEGLKMAVVAGDRRFLAEELGSGTDPTDPVRVNHNVGQGGCDPGGDDPESGPEGDGDEADDTPHPSAGSRP
jgi:hypothetical protein